MFVFSVSQRPIRAQREDSCTPAKGTETRGQSLPPQHQHLQLIPGQTRRWRRLCTPTASSLLQVKLIQLKLHLSGFTSLTERGALQSKQKQPVVHRPDKELNSLEETIFPPAADPANQQRIIDGKLDH